MSLAAAYFNNKSTSHGVAIEPTEALIFPASLILQWQLKYPSWNKYVMRMFRSRYDQLIGSFERVVFEHINVRVLEYLKQKSIIEGNGMVYLSHQNLADELGTTRVVVSRILKQFEREMKIAGGTLTQASTLTVADGTGDDITVNGNYIFSTGTLNGTGSMLVTGGMDWQAGTLRTNLILAPGAISGKSTAATATILTNGVLTNNGTFNWTDGNINFQDAVFNNGGTITASGNNSLAGVGGFSTFTNTGTFTKNNNLGTTTISTGTLTNSGTIKGVGTLALTFLSSNGTIAPGASPGLLTINGAQPFSANSTLQIEMQDGSGPGTGHDQSIRNGDITLAGKLVVTETGALPNGTYTIINLTSGTVSGSFSTVTLPAGYVLQVNASNVQITRNIVLPLSLLSFTGTLQNGTAQLQWQVSNEINTASFVIERSNGATAYTSVGNVAARNVSGNNSYNFTDNNAFTTGAVQLYRLKIIDKDGRFVYSAVIKLTNKQINQLTVFPNPVTDMITISGLQQKEVIKIFDVTGSLIQQQTVTSQAMTLNIANHSNGIYFLQYMDGEKLISSQKIIRQ
jgi:hypothetical protein